MSIANLCGSLQGKEDGLGCLGLVAKPRKRPVFHKALGEMLLQLRTARGWSVQEAVNYSQPQHANVLTWNILTRIESGKTKHPDSEALRALSDLYKISYTELATAFVSANYGRDLFRHGSTGQQDSHHEEGESDVPASARRIADLERQLADYETRLREMQDVASRLVKLAALGSREEREAARVEPRRSRRDRKTGR